MRLTEKAKDEWNRLAEDYQEFRDETGTCNELVKVPAMLNLIGEVNGKTILDAGS